MHRPDSFPVLLFLLLVVPLRTFAASPIQERADRFLALANAGYQALYRVNSEAQWTAVTDVTPEHDAAAEAAGKAYARSEERRVGKEGRSREARGHDRR